ncbi:DUF4232 domain-containing protein [Actinoallomurus sp. NBC_01490]|uniref:DUF4232 domain-containing protein n=1 Tax=Actinoallomurus sp. NBC_01490 TaxID=2903557 RepID=UPI002E314CCA|nr:DUF4232 domain-containing protein [Actinoallomurus sp. NBC_01490]
MSPKTRALVVAGALASAALTATGSAAATRGTAPQAATDVPACETSHTQVNLHESGFAAAGNTGLVLTLTNASDHTCRVDGYPGLVMEDSQHRALPTNVTEGSTYITPDPGTTDIDLAPGERASAFVGWSTPEGTSDVTPSYLRVSLPGGTGYLRAPFQPANVTNGNLGVTALARHTPVPY